MVTSTNYDGQEEKLHFKQFLESPDMVGLEQGGESVTVRVYDPSIAYLKHGEECFETLATDGQQAYKNELAAYKIIKNHNAINSSTKINRIKIHKHVFCSFWKSNKMNRDSYLATGPSIVMEKLLEKPQTDDDFKKGSEQFRRLLGVGIQVSEITKANMFMSNDEFVFDLYEPILKPSSSSKPETVVQIENWWADAELRFKSFLDYWKEVVIEGNEEYQAQERKAFNSFCESRKASVELRHDVQ